MRVAGLAASLAVFLAACAPEGERPARTIQNGVETVMNRTVPYKLKNEPGSFSLSEDLVLDLEREELAAKGLTQPRGFEVAPGGEMFVLCESGIFVFDASGRFRRQFGRSGQGPGEYQNPGRLRMLDSGELSFFDEGGDKFLYFNSEGVLLREVRNASKIHLFSSNGALCLGDAGYLFEEMNFDPAQGRMEYHLALTGADFRKTARLAESISKENPLKANRYNLFDGYIKYVVSGGRIYAASQGAPQFEINVYDFQGKRLRAIQKEWRKIRIPQSYKDAKLGAAKGSIGTMLKEKGYFPDYYPAVKELYVDGRGRLLVETYEAGPSKGEMIADVFSPDGTFIGEQPIASTLARFIKGDRFYALIEKESGFQKLTVYKMNWH
jgi:hypothetical protein